MTEEILFKDNSKGVVTELAIFSGLAPDKEALIEIIGTSVSGREATGSKLKQIIPAIAMPIASNVVAIGLFMNIEEKLIAVRTYEALNLQELQFVWHLIQVDLNSLKHLEA